MSEIKVLTGQNSLESLWKGILPCYFLASGSPGIPWLVVASLQSLPPSSCWHLPSASVPPQDALFCVRLNPNCPFLIRTLVMVD